MKIYFSEGYTPGAYVNLDDCGGIAFDCTVAGLEALVALIELHLGLHHEAVNQDKRRAEWLKCMRKVMDKGANVLTESWIKNRLGVSNECLQWRDLLRLAKWRNDMHQPAERFKIIAEADRQFAFPSTGDRIITILERLDRNPFGEATTIYVGELSADALMPAVAELLARLESLGVEVVYDRDRIAAPAGSNLAKVQSLLCTGHTSDKLAAADPTFSIWEFDTANDACRYIALLPEGEFDLCVLSNGKLLDNTHRMLGQPTSGTTVNNCSPQIAQMFLLGMNLFEYPLNIHNLLAWLQLPLHPIKASLRRELVKAIVDTTGVDNDRYHQAIAQYLAILPDADEREKVERALDTFDVRPEPKVDVDQLRTFNKSLYDWATMMASLDDMDESRRQQLFAVASLCSTLQTILEDIAEPEIPYSRLQAGISTLYNGSDFRIYNTRAGSLFTTDCRGIVSDADSILWGDCYNYEAVKSRYDFLNADERAQFAAEGCKFQNDNDFNRAAIRSLKMPVLRARRKCVIVTTKHSAGAETTEHPIFIQLKEGFKDSIKNVTEHPSAAVHETREVPIVANVPIENQINVSWPLAMPDHESYSSLSQLIQFPLDYVLEKIARIYSSSSTDLKQVKTVKGDVAHKVIETLFTGTADEIAARIDDEYNALVGNVIEQQGAVLLLPEHQIECTQFKAELRECLDALAGIIKENNLTVKTREHEIRTRIGLMPGDDDVDVKGFIDMVLSDKDGNLYVFDFKWSDSRSYHRKLLADNLSLQLALYKRMLERDTGKAVAACAYFVMPIHKLFTVSLGLTGSNVALVEPANTDDIVAKAINSYRYRRAHIQEGVIDYEEGWQLQALAYTVAAESDDLFPLEVEERDKIKYHTYNIFSNYGCFKINALR